MLYGYGSPIIWYPDPFSSMRFCSADVHRLLSSSASRSVATWLFTDSYLSTDLLFHLFDSLKFWLDVPILPCSMVLTCWLAHWFSFSLASGMWCSTEGTIDVQRKQERKSSRLPRRQQNKFNRQLRKFQMSPIKPRERESTYSLSGRIANMYELLLWNVLS